MTHIPRLKRVLLGSAIAFGCGLQRLDQTGGPQAGVPSAVQTVFDAKCATPGCHSGAPGAGGLSLEASASAGIIGRASVQMPSLNLVELGAPDASYLLIKMMRDDQVPSDVTRIGARMPTGITTDDPELAVIWGWVAGAGFPDDGAAGTSGTGP